MKPIHLLPLAALLLSACQHDALSEARTVVSDELGAGSADAYAEGKVHLQNERYDLALTAFGRDLQQNGPSVPVLNGLAATYSALGRDDLALRHLTEAEKLDPESAVTAQNLAHFRRLQNEAAKSIVASAAPLAQAPSASSRKPVYVQLAAYHAEATAAALAAKLSALGARVMSATHDGRTVHRVRIGPLTSADDAQAVLKRAREIGIRDGFILSAL